MIELLLQRRITMKRIKCPKCELNYMFEGQEMCEVCLKEKSRNIYNKTNSFNSVEDYYKAMESSRSSASPWFFDKYLKDIESRYDELTSDLGYKQEYIKCIFETEQRDSEITGTTTRVDSVIRFIRLARELSVFIENQNK